MKELKFDSGPSTTLAVAQANDKLAATIRYADERGISEGDTIAVLSAHTGEQMGTAEVTHTESQPVRRALNVVDLHWAEYGLQTPDELVKALNGYYDNTITMETEVKVIILNPDLDSAEPPAEERPAPLKFYEISAQALVLALQTGNVTKVLDGIPSGADLVDYGYEPQRQIFYVTVEHESFDDVHEGERIPNGTVDVQEVIHTQWGGLTQYELDGDDVIRVDAYRVDPEEEVFRRVSLDSEDKVGFKADVGVPDRFEFVGTAENHKEPPTVWGVWATHGGEEWGTTKLSEVYDGSV